MQHVFNHVPDLANIRPAKLRKDAVRATKRCKATGWKCGAQDCMCCGIWPAFHKDGASNPVHFCGQEFVDGSVDGWKALFESTSNLAAAQSLPGKFALGPLQIVD